MRFRAASYSAATVLFVVAASFAFVGGGIVALWQGYDAYVHGRQEVIVRDAGYAHTLSRTAHIFLSSAATSVAALAAEASTAESMTFDALQPLVERFANVHQNTFISMYVVGVDGVEIADFFPSGIDDADRLAGIGIDLRDRPYFQKVVNTGRPVISDAVIGRSTNRAVVVVAVPIFDASGTMRAIAAGSLDLQMLRDLAIQAVEGAEQRPIIVDASGQAIVHPDIERARRLERLSGLEPARQALTNGGSGAVASYVGVDGGRYSAAYRSVPSFGWGVWVARDATSLATAVGDVARAAVPVFVVATLLAGLAFMLAARLVFLPLIRMSDQVERIAAGDFAAHVNLDGTIATRESVMLAERFNAMAGRISEMTDRLKTNFLFRTVHDLRSLISVLSLSLEMHEEAGGRRDSKTKREAMIANMRTASARMSRLVEDLLKIAKGDNADLALERESVDVMRVAREVALQMAPAAAKREVTVVVESKAGVVLALGDANALREVVDNLIGNAIKYNRPGGTVTVSGARNAGNVFFTVSDTGTGIASEHIDKVFTPYFREGDDASIQGTGLGLHIVKNFVEKMNGTVSVESEKGVGTTFTVTLPRA